MQLFYFILKTGRQAIPDCEGEDFVDESAARLHAAAVAQQIMRHREVDSRGWRIQICDDYLRPLSEVYFLDVDETLKHLPLHMRSSMERMTRMMAALNDALLGIQAALSDARQTLTRADDVLNLVQGQRR